MSGHFNSGDTLKRHNQREWLAVTSQIGELVNTMSDRGDLVAYVGDDGGRGVAAALFDPYKFEVEVNTSAAFGKLKPAKIGDLRKRKVQFKHTKATGAIFHEACHAKHTTWDLKKAGEALTARENEALHILEESRIEKYGLLDHPENRAFLRSCTLDIVLADLSEEQLKSMSQTRQAAHMAALTLARVDGGTLEESDVVAIRKQIETVLPTSRFDEFREIWLDFQAINRPTHAIDRMYDLARRWEKLVEETAKENGEPSDEEIAEAIKQMMEGAGEPGDEEGSGSGTSSGFAQAVMDALGEDAEATAVGAQEEMNEQEDKEETKERTEQRKAQTSERNEAKSTAQRIFSKPNPGPSDGNTRSRLVETRKPKAEERIAAVKIAEQLERAKYRDKDKTTVSAMLPPGRLRTRVAMQGDALRENGVDNAVSPWRQVVRTQTEEPKITIGVMVDISGSMSGAMEPMAVTAWALSEAVRRVQGRTGMVYYGNSVFQTLKPGTHLDKVTVYSASDSSHNFDDAFKALDGGLDLLYGSGARLLVICSDGQYGGYGGSSFGMGVDQATAVDKWLRRCQASGVGVLWIGFPECSNDPAKNYCAKTDAVYVDSSRSVVDAAMAIGRAAEKALTAAGSRRG